MMAQHEQLKQQMNDKYGMLEKAIRDEMNARLGFESDVKRLVDERWRSIAHVKWQQNLENKTSALRK